MEDLEIKQTLLDELKNIGDLYSSHSLYNESVICYNLGVKETTEIDTAGVMLEARNYIILYNPNFIKKLDQRSLRFILLHELHHLIYNSLRDLKLFEEEVKRSKKIVDVAILANICEDALINGMLRYNYKEYKLDINIFGASPVKDCIYPNTLAKYMDTQNFIKFKKKLKETTGFNTANLDLLYIYIGTLKLMRLLLNYLPQQQITLLVKENEGKLGGKISNSKGKSKEENNKKNDNNNNKDANKDGSGKSKEEEQKQKEIGEALDRLQKTNKDKLEDIKNKSLDSNEDNEDDNKEGKQNREDGEAEGYNFKGWGSGGISLKDSGIRATKPEKDLYDILIKYMKNENLLNTRTYSSYNTRNSIYSVIYNSKIVLPGKRSSASKNLKDTILIVDVSGSICIPQRETYINNIAQLLKKLNNNVRLHIVTWSDDLLYRGCYTKRNKIEDLKLPGNGGNDIRPVFSENFIEKVNKLPVIEGAQDVSLNPKMFKTFDVAFFITDALYDIKKEYIKHNLFKKLVWIVPEDIKERHKKPLELYPNSVVERLVNF